MTPAKRSVGKRKKPGKRLQPKRPSRGSRSSSSSARKSSRQASGKAKDSKVAKLIKLAKKNGKKKVPQKQSNRKVLSRFLKRR